ncbi:MAG: carbonic anhydrase, partial [Ignavibacteriales bacterium]|nr:carbonic anhydrase [Ignavibacteriales bacterium]
MNRLISINSKSDIFHEYLSTPISDLVEYHNLSRPYDSYTNARLLVGMCMDNRKFLRIPDNFAYIIRTGGANLR